MSDPYDLIDLAGEYAEVCKCPCEWGDVASPAVSYGARENQIALCCAHCDRTTRIHTMRTRKDVARLVKAWAKVCHV